MPYRPQHILTQRAKNLGKFHRKSAQATTKHLAAIMFAFTRGCRPRPWRHDVMAYISEPTPPCTLTPIPNRCLCLLLAQCRFGVFETMHKPPKLCFFRQHHSYNGPTRGAATCPPPNTLPGVVECFDGAVVTMPLLSRDSHPMRCRPHILRFASDLH